MIEGKMFCHSARELGRSEALMKSPFEVPARMITVRRERRSNDGDLLEDAPAVVAPGAMGRALLVKILGST